MATTISNPRDLVVQLLGELLYVERRLADRVLPDLAVAVRDERLRDALLAHETETRRHVERIERAFHLLEVSPTSNRSHQFESAVAQHEELAAAIVEPRLADLFHAQAALHTEQWEVAAYRSLLPLVADGVPELLRESYADEVAAAKLVTEAVDRLADAR